MAVESTKVAVVTGASSGIGRATAAALKGAGYRVFGTSRQAKRDVIGDGIEWLPIDIASDASVTTGVEEILDRAGRIDLLVNNAGIGVVGGGEESSIDQAQALFDTNFFGSIRMTQAALPVMRRRRVGRIINVSSVLGFLPAPFMALYSASKHAMHGYSQSLDHELRDWGIRVLLVEPAYTATRFDKNVLHVDRQQEAYDVGRGKIVQLLEDVMATADSPDTVAATILAAATARSPKLRNPSGPLARQLTFLSRFAPTGMVDRGLRKQARLS